jgi:predicted TIM-barrel fold metal-dependent hydrolase
MYSGFKVIDGDGHMYEPADLWDKYVEKEFYDKRPIIDKVIERSLLTYKTTDSSQGDQFAGALRAKTLTQDIPIRFTNGYNKWWSVESRIEDMDRVGWDLQVCLPTNGQIAMTVSFTDAQLGAALARAYNNWAYDFCANHPDRLKFVSIVPGGSIEEFVREARRSVQELGAVSLQMPQPVPGTWWHQAEYDPLWEAASDLDFPLSLHGGGPGAPHSAERYNKLDGAFRALTQAIGFPFENMISIGHFMYSGILDRFPKMRISILEGNAGWVPFWLNRLEKCCEGRQAVFLDEKPLQATPQEYFQRQCFVAADADEPSIDFVINYIGDENIIFNTDYPHPDAPAPEEPVPNMLKQPISDQSKKRILWDNSVSLYGPRLLTKS